MNLNKKMSKLISEIDQLLPDYHLSYDDVRAREFVVQLIDVYNSTDSKKVRKLINRFVQLAGPSWVAKLRASEAKQITTITRLVPLKEYLVLVAENDPSQQWHEAS